MMILSTLKSLKLKMLTTIRTKYVLNQTIGVSNRKGTIIANIESTARLYFLHKSSQQLPSTASLSASTTTLYINQSALVLPFNIEVAISFGLCQLFNLDVSLSFTVASILQSNNMNETHSLMDSLHLSLNSMKMMKNKYRGLPGEELIDIDISLIELKPFRVFRVGEIIAFENNDNKKSIKATSASTSGASSTTTFTNAPSNTSASSDVITSFVAAVHNNKRRLYYGKVLNIGNPNDFGIRRLTIKISASESTSMLSTEIYSFKSAREIVSTTSSSTMKSSRDDKTVRRSSGDKNPDNTLKNDSTKILRNSSATVGNSNNIINANNSDEASSDIISLNEVMGAVNSLLSRGGISLDAEKEQMVMHMMDLQEVKKQLEKELAAER